MNKHLLRFLTLVVCAACAQAQNKTDEAAVQKLPQAFVAAWARHDGQELAKLMSDDVDFVNVGGVWLHGRADFELYHSRLLSGPFKSSTLKVLDTAVRFPHPNLAVLHWTWLIQGDGMADPATHAPRRGIFTMIVEKRGADWLIAVAQNTNEMTGPNSELKGIKPPITFPKTN